MAEADTAADRDAARAERKAHWEGVYRSKPPTEVSWYQERPDVSLAMIRDSGIDKGAPIVDVGGGASRLVDFLLEDGYEDLTVLDVSAASLEAARARLGTRAARVAWIVEDVTRWRPPRTYRLWHDRAVFHFLTDPADRAAYRSVLEGAVGGGGHVVVAAFGPDGPERCSGLPIVRYEPKALAAELGEAFVPTGTRREIHRTPWGATQAFVYCGFRRREGSTGRHRRDR